MKKILLLAALMLTASYVHAQAMVTGNLTIAGTAPACVVGACVHLNVSPEFGGATFTLNGTWSGTVTFYGSGDGGVTLVALTAFPSNSSTGVTSATGNGTWRTSLSGYTDAYLIFTTASSGTVVATINPSHISAGLDSGGGGGGSAVTCSVAGGVYFETSSTTGSCDSNFVWNNTTKILDLNNVSSGAQGLNLTNTAAPSGYIAKEFFGGGPAGGGTANGNFVLETLGAGGALAGALEIATNTGGIQILGPSAGYNGGLGGGFITLTYDGTVTIQAPTGGPGVVFESPTVNFPGSSSGNASIAAAAAAGSPCTLVFPIVSPTAGQVLSSAAPSGGSCQESWATVSSSFSAITGGTNTTAAMVLGSGSSLTYSGTGSNNASILDNIAVATNSPSNTNLFIGTSGGLAGNGTTTGLYSTAFGFDALAAQAVPTSGVISANTAVGYEACQSVTTATQATCIGYQAGQALTGNGQGIEDGLVVFVGDTAGHSWTGTGSSQTDLICIGQHSCYYVNAGGFSIVMGNHSADGIDSASDSVIIGDDAMGITSSQTGSSSGDVIIGENAAYNVTGAFADNVLIGMDAANSATAGSLNVIIGYQAGYDDTTAVGNTFVGTQAGYTETTHSGNTYIGYQAGEHSASSNNTMVGTGAGNANVGFNSTCIGSNACGNSQVSGSNNVTAIGYQACDTLTNGGNDVCLGDGTEVSSAGDNNEIIVGQGLTGNGSNTTTIGNSSTTDTYFGGGTSGASNIHGSGYYSGATAGISSSGHLCSATFTSVLGLVTACTAVSDPRLKVFGSYAPGLNAIMKIDPIHFHYNQEGLKLTSLSSDSNHEQIGFSAKNVQQAIPEAVGTQRYDDIDYLTLPQGDRPIVAALVNAVKEQQKEIDTLKSKVRKLQARK